MRTARWAPRIWLAVLAMAPAWPAAAQQDPQLAHHDPTPPAAAAPRLAQGSVLDDLHRRFDELLARTTPASAMPGTRQKAQMFDDFLVWPRSPLDVVLVVRFTSATGVGPPIGTLTVKNSEIAVAGRKEVALFIQPDLRLPPGIYAFHVHENPDCGPAMKDGESVPGLAAGGHLSLAGTGALSGTTFTSHLGDLPHLKTDADGWARQPVVAARLTMADVVKRSFMIHASEDDNAARLACAAFD